MEERFEKKILSLQKDIPSEPLGRISSALRKGAMDDASVPVVSRKAERFARYVPFIEEAWSDALAHFPEIDPSLMPIANDGISMASKEHGSVRQSFAVATVLEDVSSRINKEVGSVVYASIARMAQHYLSSADGEGASAFQKLYKELEGLVANGHNFANAQTADAAIVNGFATGLGISSRLLSHLPGLHYYFEKKIISEEDFRRYAAELEPVVRSLAASHIAVFDKAQELLLSPVWILPAYIKITRDEKGVSHVFVDAFAADNAYVRGAASHKNAQVYGGVRVGCPALFAKAPGGGSVIDSLHRQLSDLYVRFYLPVYLKSGATNIYSFRNEGD